LCLGQYIKHAEKPFFKAINKAFGAHTPATVIKGVNSDVAATILRKKWDRFSNPVAIGLDATKFDMHVSVPALRYEHSFYKMLFPGSKHLEQLLKLQLHNTGTAFAGDGSVSFAMDGTRCSGDLNTSLGNCIIMCALVWAFLDEMQVAGELCNNGDDCVVIMESEHLEAVLARLPGWFRKKGFAMTVEDPVFVFEQIEFCQTKPVLLGTGWRMVRNHVAILKKDPMCLVPINNQSDYQKWLHAVGECGSILASGVPVQHEFYRCFLRHGLKGSDGFVQGVFRNTAAFERIQNLQYCDRVTPEARVSYYYAFGITPDHQVELENFFSKLVLAPLDFDIVSRDSLVLEPGISLLL
jgi:hypothetical protein